MLNLTGADGRLENGAHMGALIRCLLAMALAMQFALAGLCLVHDEPDASARVIHLPCAHQYQTHTAALRSRRLEIADHTLKHSSITMPPPGVALAALLPRDPVSLQSRLHEVERAVLSARGPPCRL
jgi:hypothetical protein